VGTSKSYELHLSPSEKLTYGKYESQLNLIALTNTGKTLPPKKLLVSCSVVPPVRVDQNQLQLGICRLNEERSVPLTISSRDGLPFKVISHESDSDNLIVELDGQTSPIQSVRVTLRPSRRGAQQSAVRMTIAHDKCAAGFDLEIPVFYYGTGDPSSD
jgi:hypothetical protein